MEYDNIINKRNKNKNKHRNPYQKGYRKKQKQW